MSRHLRITGPAVIAFSGGRSSGMLLKKILEAHGGVLPADVRVVFANTGRERTETLDFIEKCSKEWSVPITWLEYRWTGLYSPPVKGSRSEDEFSAEQAQWERSSSPTRWAAGERKVHSYVVVDHFSASRNGRPFREVIAHRRGLPGPKDRFCVAELKAKTIARYARQSLGWRRYTLVTALRYDEQARHGLLTCKCGWSEHATIGTLHRGSEESDKRRARSDRIPGETPLCPLYHARVTAADVDTWWKDKPFGLSIPDSETGCDGCFLKTTSHMISLFQRHPELASWWIAQEGRRRRGPKFRRDRPRYRELLALSADGAPAATFRDIWPMPCRCTD